MSDRGSENGFGTISAGSYNNETNVITVNVGVNHPKGLEHTIVHEYMHALTAHQIRIGGPKIDASKSAILILNLSTLLFIPNPS